MRLDVSYRKRSRSEAALPGALVPELLWAHYTRVLAPVVRHCLLSASLLPAPRVIRNCPAGPRAGRARVLVAAGPVCRRHGGRQAKLVVYARVLGVVSQPTKIIYSATYHCLWRCPPEDLEQSSPHHESCMANFPHHDIPAVGGPRTADEGGSVAANTHANCRQHEPRAQRRFRCIDGRLQIAARAGG